jgi:hypothetical protein
MKNPAPTARPVTRLERLGLDGFVAGLLEAGGEPLRFLAAQGFYLAQPILGLWMDEAALAALAGRLEEPAGAPAKD